MIDGQNIHDALNLLPEDLIAPVDALRQRKRFPWKSLATTAACIALCVGLLSLIPAGMKAGSTAPERADGAASMENGSTQHLLTADLSVYQVEDDHIYAVGAKDPMLDAIGSIAATCITFENLSTVPELKPGQKIRIYYTKKEPDGITIKPVHIEIIE